MSILDYALGKMLKNYIWGDKMKITIPKAKKPVKFIRGITLYVVISQYRGGTWGIASYFGEEYVSHRYLQATKFKKRIIDNLWSGGWWKKKHFKVAKITF